MTNNLHHQRAEIKTFLLFWVWESSNSNCRSRTFLTLQPPNKSEHLDRLIWNCQSRGIEILKAQYICCKIAPICPTQQKILSSLLILPIGQNITQIEYILYLIRIFQQYRIFVCHFFGFVCQCFMLRCKTVYKPKFDHVFYTKAFC